MITGRDEGANITVLNTMYSYPKKDENGKYDNGYIDILYKDLDTGKKYVECIENPDYEFYMLKDGYSCEYNNLFIEKEKVNKITVPYKSLELEIAKLTGNQEFYNDCITNGNRSAIKQLHTIPSIFNSDIHIEDHYRYRFNKLYKNEPFKISKLYFDIEVDVIDLHGEFPEPGECPINAVTLINDLNNKIYTLLLRNERNPLIQEFEDNIQTRFFDRIKDTIRDAIGGWKQEKRFGLDKFDYEVMFYDEEILLIVDIFKIINTFKPDFVLAWNIAFDLPYIIERIKVLGYDPRDIVCHPDFKHKMCEYYIQHDVQEKHKKGDYYNISSYSVYLDQMVRFASRRASDKNFKIVNLDYVGNKIVKVRKLDYSDICPNIAMLPYKDYEIFVFYNIIDTIVQKCIEVKVNDIDYVFNKCLMNHTRYHKEARQTIYLVNGCLSGFEENGYILGNNINKFKAKPEGRYPGAYVASTQKLSDEPRLKVNGQPVSLYNNLNDFDYKSLYPSITREFNLAPNTQIGKIIIDEKIWDKEDPFDYKYYDRGGAYAEDLHSHNYIAFCNRWLNLASYKELYYDVMDYFTNIYCLKMPLRFYNNEGLKDSFINVSNKEFKPFMRKESTTSPFIKYKKKPDYSQYNINVNDYVYNDNRINIQL